MRELVFVGLEFLLIRADCGGVFVEKDLKDRMGLSARIRNRCQSSKPCAKLQLEQGGAPYRPIRLAKSLEPPLGMLKLVSGQHQLVDFDDDIPELRVLLVQNDDKASCLGIEGAGHMFDGLLDDFLDAGVGDWGAMLEGVDGAAALHRREEGCGVCWVGRHDWR